MIQSEPGSLQLSCGQVLQIAKALEEQAWRDDPVLWARDVQMFEPEIWQAQLLRTHTKEVIINCCRQSGKTRMAGTKAAHYARYHPGSTSIIASRTERQAKLVQRWVADATRLANLPGDYSIESKEISVYEDDLTGAGGRILNRSVMSLELANGAQVVSIPANPDTVRGYSPNLIILDEAAYVPNMVYDAIRPMRAQTKAQLILLSSAGAKRGFFYEEWIADDPMWERMQVTADEVSWIDEEFLERERLKLSSEAFFRQEYYCEFMDVQGGLFTTEQIAAMYGNEAATAMRDQWVRDIDMFTDTSPSSELDILERIQRIRF